MEEGGRGGYLGREGGIGEYVGMEEGGEGGVDM